MSHSKAQLIATVDDLVPVVREALKNCPNVKVNKFVSKPAKGNIL